MSDVPWPWLFLAVTVWGALFTFNAYLPQRRTGPFVVPSFFAGWLTSELSAHHFAWQLAATVFFVWMGALEAWPGWLGLGITLASWAGLIALTLRARGAGVVVEEALRDALGADYRERIDPEWTERIARPYPSDRLWLPFRFRDPDVEIAGDIQYAEGYGRRRRLDVYRPRAGVRDAPVLLQIHGGAWFLSQKRHQALPLMHHLAARGWVCVAANYRLAPRARMPDPVVDLKLALRWIREHIAEFGGDPSFVAVTGGSAGGHLSALMALTANDPELQPGFEEADTSLQAAVPFYGVYDFTNTHGYQPRSGTRRFVERVVMPRRYADDPESYERVSPLFRVHADAPPFFVLHGTHDSLTPVAEARAFAEALRRASRAPVAYAELPGAQHAFELFHSQRTAHVISGVERFLCWARTRHLEARAGRGGEPAGAEASPDGASLRTG